MNTPRAGDDAHRPFSGTPGPGVPLPESVRVLAAGHAVTPVWQNKAGGLTFSVPAAHIFIKWSPVGGIDLAPEADRLRWAFAALPATPEVGIAVPRVLSHGADEGGSWLVTAAIPGRSAVDSHWLARPAVAVAAIGSALRRWHDALPVERCPYRWSTADRVAEVHRRRDELDPRRWEPAHRQLTVDEALRRLSYPPPVDRLVVCHGDACSPNTLIDDSGGACALVDLGSLGVADRWADLATATWSLEWNYGPGWAGALLDAYGIDPDPQRTAYYRLLEDLDG